jgi:hypothetical protein
VEWEWREKKIAWRERKRRDEVAWVCTASLTGPRPIINGREWGMEEVEEMVLLVVYGGSSMDVSSERGRRRAKRALIKSPRSMLRASPRPFSDVSPRTV